MKYSLSSLTFKTYVNAHTFPQKVIERTTLKVFDENMKYSEFTNFYHKLTPKGIHTQDSRDTE